MKKLVLGGLVLVLLFGFAGIVQAAEKRGTAAEAEALVKKAIAYMKSNGREAAFAEINNPKGKFTDRDLYIFV